MDGNLLSVTELDSEEAREANLRRKLSNYISEEQLQELLEEQLSKEAAGGMGGESPLKRALKHPL